MGKKVQGKGGRKPPKKVLPVPPEPDGEKYLGWRMGHVDFEGDWGWRHLALGDCEELRQELALFEQEPIRRLKDKKWLKLIPLRDIDYRAAGRLTEIERDAEEGLWQLHLARYRWRVWGFLEGASFYVLWWDPGHTVATGKCRTRSP